MLAYPNNDKSKYLARVRAHRAADQIVQRLGYRNGHGCAVGCTLDAYDHSRYPIELGAPLALAYLEDRLHEALPSPNYLDWPEQFLEAIEPGADLSGVWGRWATWMLADETHGVRRHAAGYPECEAAIDRVAELYRGGGTPEQFRAAGTAAEAARAAAEGAGAADAAARAAGWAADAAAWWAAARAAWAIAASEELLRLLRETSDHQDEGP